MTEYPNDWRNIPELRGALLPDGELAELGFRGIAGKDLLDVGCATGSYFRLWEEMGAISITGIDPHEYKYPPALPVENPNLPVNRYLMSAETAVKLNMRKFDIVTALNVDPQVDARTFATALRELVEDDGQVLITLAELASVPKLLPEVVKHFEIRTKVIIPDTAWLEGNATVHHEHNNEIAIVGNPILEQNVETDIAKKAEQDGTEGFIDSFVAEVAETDAPTPWGVVPPNDLRGLDAAALIVYPPYREWRARRRDSSE